MRSGLSRSRRSNSPPGTRQNRQNLVLVGDLGAGFLGNFVDTFTQRLRLLSYERSLFASIPGPCGWRSLRRIRHLTEGATWSGLSRNRSGGFILERHGDYPLEVGEIERLVDRSESAKLKGRP